MALTYVTNGAQTFTPTLIDGYQGERRSATIVHQILNRSQPDVTVRPAEMRVGTLRLMYADGEMVGGLYQDADGNIAEFPPLTIGAEIDSQACADAHAEGGVFQLITDEAPTVIMYYVPSGAIRRTLDDETRAIWVVEIDFHEIVA